MAHRWDGKYPRWDLYTDAGPAPRKYLYAVAVNISQTSAWQLRRLLERQGWQCVMLKAAPRKRVGNRLIGRDEQGSPSTSDTRPGLSA